MRKRIFVLACITALSGCDNHTAAPDEQPQQSLASQIEALQSDNNSLKEEISKLKETPSALHVEVVEQVKNKNISGAESTLSKMIEKFPESVETNKASQLLEKFRSDEKDREREAARLAELGFKGLKVSPNFSNRDSTLQLRSATVASRWVFDSYGDEWRYLEAEKGQRFITAKVSVSSKEKNPSLMGLAAYVADGQELRRIGTFRYRFARWDDYSSYLGNEPDYRNDFSHSSSIPFSIAAEVDGADVKRPIYLVVTQEGCFSRSEDRFANPPVQYDPTSCQSLPASLTLETFSAGKLVVVKRLE